MLICEELFLLLTTDEGSPSSFANKPYGLAGAVLADLAAAGLITFSEDKDPRVHVTGTGATGDTILDAALARVQEKEGKKLSSLVQDRKLNPEQSVVASLAAAGVIKVEEKRMLGLLPGKRPTLNPRPEQEVRERLRLVLAGGTPTVADATLLSILQGLDVAPKILKDEAAGMSRRDLKERIKQVAHETPEGAAVTKAVQQLNAVLMTAVIIPAVTSSSN